MIAGMMVFCSHAQQSLVIGNCQEHGNGRLEYVGSDAGTGFAVNFSRYKMRAYKGCSIHSINIESYGHTTGEIFISKSINDAPLYTQSFTGDNGWNEVILDTPYNIDGTELTFGYTLTTCPSGTLVVGDALIPGNEYINHGNGWEKFPTSSGHLTATLTGDNLPAAEVAVSNVVFPEFLKTGTEGMIRADIINLGTTSVKSITNVTNIDNEAVTTTIEGLNIAPRSKAAIKIPVTLAADGDYNVWIEATAVNGIKDAAPVDNTSGKSTVYAREAFVQRNVLYEVFSTERCTNCPDGHKMIGAALGKMTNVIEMTHHAGFYNDKFTIPESTAYEWFYKSPQFNTTFAPAFMTDRAAWTNHDEYYPYGTPVSMSLSTEALNAAYEEAKVVPALATITIAPTYDTETRHLNLDVEATALIATSGYDHPALNVFIVEDEVFSTTQEAARGNYHHPHMVRKCLTTTWGEAFNAGGTISRNYSLTLDEEWNADKVTIVAFVSNYNAASNSDCRVMNAEEVKLNGESSGISEVNSTDKATDIYDLQGRRLSTPVKGINIIGGKKIIL